LRDVGGIRAFSGGGRFAVVLIVAGIVVTLPLVIWSTPREQTLVLRSLVLSAATCAVALPTGAVLAALVARTDAPGRKAALLLFAAMLFAPLYLQTAAWDAGFGRQGWFSAMTQSITAPPMAGWRAVIWIHAMAAIPWVALIVAAGLRRVDPELEEAALLDASPGRVFLWVTAPLSLDAIGLAALWVFVSTLGEFTVADMYQVNTYAREVYAGLALGELGAWPGTAITAWGVLAASAFFARLTRWDGPAPVRPPRQFALRGARLLGGLFVLLAILLIVGVPLADFAYHAGIEVEQTGDERVRTWSLAKLVAMVWKTPLHFAKEIKWTLLISGAAATAAVTLAAPAAWLSRRGGWRAAPAFLLAAVGIAVPGPVIALGIITLLNRPEIPLLKNVYDYSILAPAAALVCRTFPWSLVICWFAFRSIPKETLEAAELDGVGPAGRLLRIAIPMRLAWLALAWIVAFAVASGDLAASILVMPPGIETLSVRIFGLIHAGVSDQVAAISLLIVLGVAAMTAAAWGLWRRAARSQYLAGDE
jgi:iron(III) transport system permease protein